MPTRILTRVLIGGALLGGLLFAALVFARTAVWHTWRMPSGSMYPALQAGDTVLGNQWRPQARIERGGVVIFRTEADPDTQHVKRVVGLPGEEVEVHPDGSVTIDGVPLERCELGAWPDDLPQEVERAHAVIERMGGRSWVVLARPGARTAIHRARVPEGHLFVLGDQRDNSWDSRHFGTVPLENVDALATRLLLAASTESLWEGSRPRRLDVPHLAPTMREAASRCASGP